MSSVLRGNVCLSILCCYCWVRVQPLPRGPEQPVAAVLGGEGAATARGSIPAAVRLRPAGKGLKGTVLHQAGPPLEKQSHSAGAHQVRQGAEENVSV
jgi:hypothetical protein